MKVCKRRIIFVSIFIMTLFLAGYSIAGDLNPTLPPGSTMRSLDHVTPNWSLDMNATPTGRFVQVLSNAAVLDKETGLVWQKNLNTDTKSWITALAYCVNLSAGNRKGWRMPSVQELLSLVDIVNLNPSLPIGHPFNLVQNSVYWTTTTDVTGSGFAWAINFSNGQTTIPDKTAVHYVWCVRGGTGNEDQ